MTELKKLMIQLRTNGVDRTPGRLSLYINSKRIQSDMTFYPCSRWGSGYWKHIQG